MAEIEERLARLETNVSQLQATINNDVKHTLSKIWDKVNEMCVAVKDNSYWVGKWKQAIFWVAVIAVGGGMVATAFYLLRNLAK